MAKELYDGIYSSHKMVFIERVEKNLEFYLKDKLQGIKRLGQEILCEVTKTNLYAVLKELKLNPELDIHVLSSINKYISRDKSFVIFNLSSVSNNFSMILKVQLDSLPSEKENLSREYDSLVTDITELFESAEFFLDRSKLKDTYNDIVIRGEVLDGFDTFDTCLQTDYDIIDKVFLDTRISHVPSGTILNGIDITNLLTFVSRFDYNAGIFPELCLCLALEELMQLKVTKRVQYIRMIISELFRISNHINYISKMSIVLGSEMAYNNAMIERERILRIIEFITGSRVHPNFIRIGGVKKDLSNEKINNIMENIPVIFKKITKIEALLLDNTIITAKLKNVGIADRETTLKCGVTGPNLRASGARYDLRKNRNLLLYKDVSFLISLGKYGDCLERLQLRFREIYQSINIINQALSEMPEEHIKKLINLSDLEIPFTEMVSSIECPHGVFKIFFEIKDNIVLKLVV
ncbi:MAG: hypothetical protein M1308_09835, partial [Actinobacteria bacterium]|nr:hypothetical protein [Actinomycetota bacterium]